MAWGQYRMATWSHIGLIVAEVLPWSHDDRHRFGGDDHACFRPGPHCSLWLARGVRDFWRPGSDHSDSDHRNGFERQTVRTWTFTGWSEDSARCSVATDESRGHKALRGVAESNVLDIGWRVFSDERECARLSGPHDGYTQRSRRDSGNGGSRRIGHGGG